ncbi:MAG: extracellular solute-binding protein [Clostridiales bacterium]|nr:extracellular solute-binding protein [Clostridiales bacterium]
MRKKLSATIAVCLLLSSASLTSCGIPGLGSLNDNVLRVASWDEYIDMGGEEVYDEDFMAWYQETFDIDLTTAQPLYEEFLPWYHANYKEHPEYQSSFAGIEYIALQDNETMYNKIKMGDRYDLLCPSEYMAIKLKNEGYLQAFDKDFLKKQADNHYANNLSPYVDSVLKSVALDEYLAGYMWGTTGFVFNPDKISPTVMESWKCMTSIECSRKITAKDNARDSYFMGLGMYYEDKILSDAPDHTTLTKWMNDTSTPTVDGVRAQLQKMRKNIYGLETDEAKTDVIMGWLDASYQWSGDAVFILDEAEAESGLELQYSIPKSVSNIWFDGWVMMNGANKHIANAFINFLSLPENVVRNMYYIGYTSCMAGDDVFEYVDYTYAAEEGDEEDKKDNELYNLGYFFDAAFDANSPDSSTAYTLQVSPDQLYRQLFAQYPTYDTTKRLVVMQPFNKKDNERVNRMWINIK